MTDEQEKVLVNSVERLSYALQVFASRSIYTIGSDDSTELMLIGKDVNIAVAGAFPQHFEKKIRQ